MEHHYYQESGSGFDSDPDTRLVRSPSPEANDPLYFLSGPHTHNDVTHECKSPFVDIFTLNGWRGTVDLTHKDTADKMQFVVRAAAVPKDDAYTLLIETKFQKPNHVMLLQFEVGTNRSNLRYKTQHSMVHFTTQNSTWIKNHFLTRKTVDQFFKLAKQELVTFVMTCRYNNDHDFICHETGHVKSLSCQLAKKHFILCQGEMTSVSNKNVQKKLEYCRNLNVGEEGVEQNRAVVSLPPFNTIMRRPNFVELINPYLTWWMAMTPAVNFQPALISNPMPINFTSQDLLPVTPVMATPYSKMMNLFLLTSMGINKPLPSCSYNENVVFPEPTPSTSCRTSEEQIGATMPLSCYQYSNESLPYWTQCPPVPRQRKPTNRRPNKRNINQSLFAGNRNKGLPPSARFHPTPQQHEIVPPCSKPEPIKRKKVVPIMSCHYERCNEGLAKPVGNRETFQLLEARHNGRATKVSECPAGASTSPRGESAEPSINVLCKAVPTLPENTLQEPLNLVTTSASYGERCSSNSQSYRRLRNTRLTIYCEGAIFAINSSILEDVSPILRSLMDESTVPPDSNGDFFLEIKGIVPIAVFHLLKYLYKDSTSDPNVMRSSEMVKLTQKFQINIDLNK